MKKIFLLLVIFFAAANAQVDLRAGMGIGIFSSPSLNDYLNMNYAPPGEKLGDFSTAVNFSVEAGYYLAPNFVLGMEAAYLINSYNFTISSGTYEFSYGILMPTITAYYVLGGEGYNFKFGGGVGARFTNAEEKRPVSVPTEYTATGFGILLRADGNTLIGQNVFANIGGDIRYDLNGELESGGNKLRNNAIQENVNLNAFSVGLRLGITFLF